jgi:hypothetical protein
MGIVIARARLWISKKKNLTYYETCTTKREEFCGTTE